MTTPLEQSAKAALFTRPPTTLTVTVHPGESIPMFSITASGEVIERTLVDEAGAKCDSVGKPLVPDQPRKAKKAKKSKPACVGAWQEAEKEAGRG